MKKIICFVSILFTTIFSSFITTYAAETLYATSVSGEISLRMEPSEQSMEIAKIPACAKINLIDTQQTWGQVIFENKCGWVNLSFTTDSYKNAAESTGNDSTKNLMVDAKSGSAKMYNLPSLSPVLGSKETYTVPNGFILSITRETESGWGLASMNGKYAWIELKYTEKFENENDDADEKYGIYYVYTLSQGGEGVELTSKPGEISESSREDDMEEDNTEEETEKNELLTIIPDCIKLTVREMENGYGYVSYNGINGWIDLKYTTDSQSNAQTNAGIVVNKEYVVDKDTEMRSIPSDLPESGSVPTGKIKKGKAVFVLRQTADGWSLINHDGNKGWLSPDVITPYEKEEELGIKLCDPYYIYVMSENSGEVKLYSRAGKDGKHTVSVPVCLKMQVIAKEGNRLYVVSDYAAGWMEKAQATDTYEKAISEFKKKKVVNHLIIKKAPILTIPTNSEFCYSEQIASLKEKTEIEIQKVVQVEKNKWGIVEIEGKKGWIKLENTKKIPSPTERILSIVVLCLGIIVIVYIVLLILRSIKKHKKKKKEAEKENVESRRIESDDEERKD